MPNFQKNDCSYANIHQLNEAEVNRSQSLEHKTIA